MKTKRKNEVNPLKWNVRNVWKRFNRKMKYLREYLNISLVKNKTMKYTKKIKRCKNWVTFCCNICKLFLLFDFALPQFSGVLQSLFLCFDLSIFFSFLSFFLSLSSFLPFFPLTQWRVGDFVILEKQTRVWLMREQEA